MPSQVTLYVKTVSLLRGGPSSAGPPSGWPSTERQGAATHATAETNGGLRVTGGPQDAQTLSRPTCARPGAACGHRGHAGQSLHASEPAAERADSAGTQQAAQPSQRWEQEVQSSKRRRGRQHPIVLVLEIKRGPLRTSFPSRACLQQAGPPPAQQPRVQALRRLHHRRRRLACGSLCGHGCRQC